MQGVMSVTHLGAIAVFAPLTGFLMSSLGIRYLGDRFSQWITCLGAFIATLASSLLLFQVVFRQGAVTCDLFPWIQAGAFQANWGLKLDSLSGVLIFIVTLISLLVHLYSIGYMSHDKSIPRFMGYLSFFTFAMLSLVTAPNLVQLFFGWEGVGVASYLLIGFWYERPRACAAAIKAFIVNRVGDMGLILGIAAIFLLTGSVEFDTILTRLPELATGHRPEIVFFGYSVDALTLVGILVFMGAMGKSAQLGLHTWLPDAMEGPTPVSALIHAATMVTAGVFLVCRLSPLYEVAPIARLVMVIVGAATAFFAATVALIQSDIKRVIAYSTCSQLGYMFLAAGCSAYGAALFHLTTHAFFKALLFLGAGSVIHALSEEQDMERMGGIYKLIPITYTIMWIGSLALAGIPLFAGYYSKDAILESAYLTGTTLGEYAFFVGVGVACLTGFYSWRLLLLTFHGQQRANDRVMAHLHESPAVMLIPLFLLSLGALLSGAIAQDWFIGAKGAAFWGSSLVVSPPMAEVPAWVAQLPLVAALLGILLAYIFYGGAQRLPDWGAKKLSWVYRFLVRKWGIDELYDKIFVNRAFKVGQLLWRQGDGGIIDRFGPDGATRVSLKLAKGIGHLQTGYVYHYAFGMILGILALLSWGIYQWGCKC
jgi:NADH-quinone oxidoreductase subunit L